MKAEESRGSPSCFALDELVSIRKGDEMDIRGKKIMVLGGFGEVGFAICRELLHQNPRELVVTSLRKEEASMAVERLRKEAPNSVKLTPIHGNLFVRWSMKLASSE